MKKRISIFLIIVTSIFVFKSCSDAGQLNDNFKNTEDSTYSNDSTNIKVRDNSSNIPKDGQFELMIKNSSIKNKNNISFKNSNNQGGNNGNNGNGQNNGNSGNNNNGNQGNSGEPREEGTVSAINIKILEIQVVPINGDPITISNESKYFNLLNITSQNPLLALDTRIPSGRYKQIRLILSNENTVVVNGIEKPIKVPSGQQTGIKLDGAFEISGKLLNMTLDFNSDESVHYTKGQGWMLKPVIKIASTSIVSGPFTVSGLIVDETVVANLQPDGTIKMLSTVDPRVEIKGLYFYNMTTKVLNIEPVEFICIECQGNEVLPSSMFSTFPELNVSVSTWDDSLISGTIENSNGLQSNVSFNRIGAYTLDTSTGYSKVKITVYYPNSNYENKIGLVSITSKDGKTSIDIEEITNNSAVYNFKVNHRDLSSINQEEENVFRIRIFTINNLDDLSVMVHSNISFHGQTEISIAEYDTVIQISEKQLSTVINYVPFYQ